MAELLVFAPLRIEAAMLPKREGWTVLRSGMGPERARIAAARGLAVEARAVAVVGLCAAVSPDLRGGDVVCATELRREGALPVAAPGSALVAAALRRRGLRVHVGPILSAGHVTTASERRAFPDDGVLAVDMESAWLADAAGGRPLAVIRVVVETADRDLRDPSTLTTGVRALRNLHRAAGALVEWTQAVGRRTVLLASPRSFCAGVERAIEIVERALEQRGAPIYVRKQIVHNEHVVADLERRGAVFVDELDEVPHGATVVFSAHGVSPAVRAAAGAAQLDVIDATCPLVNKVHAEARHFAGDGHTIFLVGHVGHEEVDGTQGEAPDAIRVVQDAREAALVDAPDPTRVSFLTQTTLAVDETDEVVAALRKRFPQLRGPKTDDICYATTNRQQSVRVVAREADVVLVVGSKMSSNSLRLVEVAHREGARAYLVDDERDVDVAWLRGAGTVGLTAGASAPQQLVDRLVESLRGLGRIDLHERMTTSESVQFRLPREVRT
jgi:4-hydroxy-3-methylbut-2-enyl diphosphate reductase